MRRYLSLLCLFSLGLGNLRADDQVRDAQTQLKDQGFYFGEIDGQAGKDFSAAVRRYQIRNGLEVSGELNAQVLQALGIGGGAPAAPAPAPETAPPPPARHSAPQPPVNLRRDESVADSDRRALRQEMPPRVREGEPAQPPGEGAQPSETYRGIFSGTPYASAPRPVQEETFLRAQRALFSRGLLPRGQSDVGPGPVIEEALLTYQKGAHLPLSGRLDLETLASMNLLPGSGRGNPGVAPALPPGQVAKPRTYRGVWVQ